MQQVISAAEIAAKKKAIEAAMANITRRDGKGSIMMLGSRERLAIDVIPTGSIGLDRALGVGGLPRGRIVEIYGPEASGKTTIALQVLAEAQKVGGMCAFVDAEHALDPVYASKLGVNINDLVFSQPDSGEQALEIVDELARSGGIDVIVVDSVAALTPRAELEGEMDENQVGLQARLMSKAMRKLTGSISKSKCIVIFINQIRMKIGTMGYGSPETTTGGNALKFYASVRLDVRRIGSVKQKDEAIGNQVKVKVAKNKLAAPFRVATFEVIFGKGISRSGEIIDMGIAANIIQKSGAFYSYNDTRIGQGREQARAWLEENPERMDEIAAKLTGDDNLLDGLIGADESGGDDEG